MFPEQKSSVFVIGTNSKKNDIKILNQVQLFRLYFGTLHLHFHNILKKELNCKNPLLFLLVFKQKIHMIVLKSRMQLVLAVIFFFQPKIKKKIQTDSSLCAFFCCSRNCNKYSDRMRNGFDLLYHVSARGRIFNINCSRPNLRNN